MNDAFTLAALARATSGADPSSPDVELIVHGAPGAAPAPPRGLSGYDQESVCAATAARHAVASLADLRALGDPWCRAVLWLTEDAGLRYYVSVLRDAITSGPTPQSIAHGPRSSFNGPGALVSIALDLRGPQVLLVGPLDDLSQLDAQVDQLLADPGVASVVVGTSTCDVRDGNAAASAAVLLRSGGRTAAVEAPLLDQLRASRPVPGVVSACH